MAKVRANKEGFANDPSLSMPTEQKTSESNRQKIAKIHDMFPITTKDNIAKILQYYDDDENQAINALTSDGGKEALSNWNDSGTLKTKNSKNKRKKKKGKKDSGLATSSTASFDADDSSSIHSGSHVDIEGDRSSQATENGNGNLPEVASTTETLDKILSNHDHLDANEATKPPAPTEPEIAPHKLASQANIASNEENLLHRASVSSDFNRNSAENESRVSPVSDASEKQDEHGIKKDKFRSINEGHSRHSPRQRTSSFRRNKSSSISEDSSSQTNPQAAAAPSKRGYDKCKKDLQRQAASLQRVNTQLEKGFEESEKKLQKFFADLITIVQNRQKDLEQELTRTKIEAFNLLKSRQDLCADLKKRVDRTSTLSEAEWSELRSDIKQFVTERKSDEELGKTIWFHWPDTTETIKTFGEVHPVKNVYSQRSHSGHDNAAPSNNPEPSPSSSLANEEIQSSGDKNDVANIADAAEDETHPAGKDEIPPFTKNQPQLQQHLPTEGSTRGTRIFQSKNYQQARFHPPNNRGFPNNNRGGGFPRGGRGFHHQQRPYPRNNYQYNRQNYGEDYNRNHPERQANDHFSGNPRPANDHFSGNPRPANDHFSGNPSQPRDFHKGGNRSRGRGGNYGNNNYRNYDKFQQKGGNSGGGEGPKHSAEHSGPPGIANSNVVEKANAVNGFVAGNNN